VAGLTDDFAMLAEEAGIAAGKDFSRGRSRTEHGAKAVDGATLHIDAGENWMLDGAAAIFKETVGLLCVDDIAGEKDDAGGLNVAKQIAQAAGKSGTVKANDEQLAHLLFPDASFANHSLFGSYWI
jgi:hypothetical protein